jgi:hypothetical protein
VGKLTSIPATNGGGAALFFQKTLCTIQRGKLFKGTVHVHGLTTHSGDTRLRAPPQIRLREGHIEGLTAQRYELCRALIPPRGNHRVRI